MRASLDGTGLQVRLESTLPKSLPVGRASAIFCHGHCFAAQERVTGLELVLGGVAHRPLAMAMPRRDLLDTVAGGPQDPRKNSYRSGFWSTLPIPAQPKPGKLALDAVVALAGGTTTTVRLGSIEVTGPERPHWDGPPVSAETIVVCMTTFEPELDLFEVQIESLRAQSDQEWVCVVSDDATSDRRYGAMRELLSRDARFVLSRGAQRAGPYRNFERALTMAPAEARLFALSDQDDRWYPDKLASLREGLGSSQLVFSDLRLVDRHRDVLCDSLWEGRRNEYRNLASMLIANSVPGAAMLFTRQVADLALPFPEQPGFPFHDHWLALAALAAGEIAYVDRPLYDYVQHVDAVSGDLVRRRMRPHLRRSGWRGAYFAGYLPRKLQAETLLLRCGPRLGTRKRRALSWLAAADRQPSRFLWLLARPVRRFAGRDETLGGEVPLIKGIIWRWLIGLAPARAWSVAARHDARFPDPPVFEQPRLRRWRAAISSRD